MPDSTSSTRPALRTESLLSLTWPIFLQNLSTSLVVLVDFFFFSQLSDATAGTVGQLMPVFWMGAFVINIFATAGISVASQFMGALKHDRVVPTYMTNLLVVGSLGCLYAALMFSLGPYIGRWMGMSPALQPIATSYLRAISPFFVFHGVLAAYNAVISSRGMTHWLMYTSFLVAGVNFALDPLFVFTFDLGVAGVAWASVCGAITAAGLAMWLVHRRLGIRFDLATAREKLGEVLPLLTRVGVSTSVEPFSYSCQQTLISTLVIAMGVTSMAANNYAARSHMFQVTFAFSLASGTQILAAHWMGAGRQNDVDRLFWRTLGLGMLTSFTYSVLLWLLAPWVLQIFTDDPAILALGSQLLLISLVTEPARAVNIIGGITLKTVGDTRFPMLLGFVFIWGILPVVFGLNDLWGLSLRGLWLCFALDELLRAIINAWRWRTGHWRSMAFARREAPLPATAPPQESPKGHAA